MNAATHPTVDWPAVLNELRRMNVRTGAIAAFTGRSSGNIREYRLAIKRPMYDSGERIIVLWMQATGKGRDEVPMTQMLTI
jgi:hypothetical protein